MMLNYNIVATLLHAQGAYIESIRISIQKGPRVVTRGYYDGRSQKLTGMQIVASLDEFKI